MIAFRRAVEAKDLAALVDCFAPDVVFQSPVVFAPYEGRATVGALLEHVIAVLEDFTYVSELESGRQAVLRFRARVGGREVDGIDFLEHDAEGKVKSLAVFVRPQSAAIALADAMRARLAGASSSG